MHSCFQGWRVGLFFVVLLAMPCSSESVQAQSIRIHTGGWGGGFHLGINTGPRFGYGHSIGYGAYGFPGYGFGYGYGIGLPYSSYRYGYPSIYDTYRAQSMYRDYRADYYDRLLNSYRYGIQRDLTYEFPRYQSLYADPFDVYPSYQPPVVVPEPFFDPRDEQIIVPEISARIAPAVPVKSLPESLRASATHLAASLSRRSNDGDVWLDYLQPGKIVQTIDQGLPADSLLPLMRNYDGVVGNPELRFIANADGFARTRQLLRQWLETSSPQPEQQPMPADALQPDVDGDDEGNQAEPTPEESIREPAVPAEPNRELGEDVEKAPVPAPVSKKVRVSV